MSLLSDPDYLALKARTKERLQRTAEIQEEWKEKPRGSIAENSEIERYRTRVHFLSQDLWEATDKVARVNLLIQLADAVTSLLHLENKA